MKCLISFCIISVGLIACNRKAEAHKQTASPSAKEQVLVKPVFTAPDSFQIGLGKVYTSYLNIQEALAEDDFQKAKDAFAPVHAILGTLHTDGLDGTAKAYWDSSDIAFMQVLHPIAASKNIEEIRGHFMDFTPILADVFEKFGIMTQEPIYLFHCPMYHDGKKADWMQNSKTTSNPFLGKSMPTCGDLVKEVKTRPL